VADPQGPHRPADEADSGDGESADAEGVEPAPLGALDDPEDEPADADAGQDRADGVEAGGVGVGGIGCEEGSGAKRDSGERRAGHERRDPGKPLEQGAG